MLKVINLSKQFPDGPVLAGVSFVLNDGEKVGLVGPNGSGKSTLLRILAGHTRPSGGAVVVSPGQRTGYLEQFPEADLHRSVAAALAAARPGLVAAQAEMERLAAAMAAPDAPDPAALVAAYGAATERFEQLGGYEMEHRTAIVRAGLALDEIEPDRLVGTLSGGQKTRVALARLLLSEPSILLLDEPTNYLDLPALLWLERFVATSPHAAIIVSHDRRFLDRTVTGILEIDADRHTLARFAGNFTAYAAERARQRAAHAARYQDQVERIETVEREIGALKGKATATERGTINFHYRKIAKGVARRAKVQERRLERYLASEERLERPEDPKHLYLEDLRTTALPDDRMAVTVADLTVRYGPTPVLAGVDLTIHGGDRLALVGANGSGKSTLLRALAGHLPIEGARRVGDDITIGFLPQEHPADPATGDRSVLDSFRANVVMHEDEARAFLDKFLFSGDEVRRRLADLSYGERARLALAGLVVSGANLLLLDEPTSHLDLDALDRLEMALATYPGPLVVASHDRAFLDAIGITGLLLIEGGRVRPLPDLDAYEATLPGDRAGPRR